MDSEVIRRKKIYLRAICGIKKGLIQNRRIIWMTLTTSDSSADGLNNIEKMELINKSWNSFRRFLQLDKKKGGFGLKFDYLIVTTNEGNGVIHLLLIGFPFIYWLKICRMWNYYHGSQLVSIAKFKGSAEKMAGYLMSQYLANQKCIFRYMMSRNFICKRFNYYWNVIKRCSRNYKADPIFLYGRWIYPIDFVSLKINFIRWLDYYIRKSVCLEYVP